MNKILFTFDPLSCRQEFSEKGYVHIKNGVMDDFLKKAIDQVAVNMKSRLMKEFAISDKQHAMYEFPTDGDYIAELKNTVATVCGFAPEDVVLSERHIKGYEANAEPKSHANKDRFASEICLGISIHVREGSTLVLYPEDLPDINPFNASTLLRASISPDRYPEPLLKNTKRVEIRDSPGDVIIFRGHSFWHLRENPANTTMLYLKLNALNCDPLGEDSQTAALRSRTEGLLRESDDEPGDLSPLGGRRVDYIHKTYNRNWEEVIGVILWGEKHFMSDEQELAILRSANGRKKLSAIISSIDGSFDRNHLLQKVRRTAKRGITDLV